jgi:hypothetical protein
MSSKRQYLSQAELAEYADITITNTTEADDQISQAEELIDTYVGFQRKFLGEDVKGRVASATSTTFNLETQRHVNVFQKNYFTYCEVEIIGGTGSGQRRTISASTYEGVVTVSSVWTTTPDSTSYYRIYQLGKFPRACDTYFDGQATPSLYLKNIPEALKRATAAQVQYMIQQGTAFFSGENTIMQSETIGDYSYTRGNSGDGTTNLIAPKAKQYLKGITNRKGVMLVGD